MDQIYGRGDSLKKSLGKTDYLINGDGPDGEQEVSVGELIQ